MKPGDLPEVSISDAYRAYMRGLYNSTGGRRGAWLRGRDGVMVPDWFVRDLEDRARTAEATRKGMLRLIDWLEENYRGKVVRIMVDFLEKSDIDFLMMISDRYEISSKVAREEKRIDDSTKDLWIAERLKNIAERLDAFHKLPA